MAKAIPPISREDHLILSLANMPAKAGSLQPSTTLLLFMADKIAAGRDSFPGPNLQRVAEFFGVSRGTMQNARKQLISAGFLQVNQKSKKDSTWALTLPEIQPNDIHNYFSIINSKTDSFIASKPIDNTEKTLEISSSADQKQNETDGEPTKKKHKLTDEDKTLICSSFEKIERWLLFGVEGLTEPDDSKLKPTPMNWRVVGQSTNDAQLKVKEWTVQHFAAYFWWRVCSYRKDHQIPMTIPNFGRICKAINEMRSRMTAWELAQRIANICGHFDLIRFELNWANICLDESALQDQNIIKKVVDIDQSGQLGLQSRYDKLHKALAEEVHGQEKQKIGA